MAISFAGFTSGELWIALVTFLYVDFLDTTGTLFSMANFINNYVPGMSLHRTVTFQCMPAATIKCATRLVIGWKAGFQVHVGECSCNCSMPLTASAMMACGNPYCILQMNPHWCEGRIPQRARHFSLLQGFKAQALTIPKKLFSPFQSPIRLFSARSRRPVCKHREDIEQ